MQSDQIKVPRTREEFIEMVQESLANDRAYVKKADAWIRKLAKIKNRASRSNMAQWKSLKAQTEKNIRGQERLLKRMGVPDTDE